MGDQSRRECVEVGGAGEAVSQDEEDRDEDGQEHDHDHEVKRDAVLLLYRCAAEN
jgi:hypothetical protein